METTHREALRSRWNTFSLAQQLGNIGSEVGRTRRAQGKDSSAFENARDRALELYDLTLDDPRWRGRMKEVARSREAFCDAVHGGKEFHTSLDDLERYFLQFALLARKGV